MINRFFVDLCSENAASFPWPWERGWSESVSTADKGVVYWCVLLYMQ